MLLRMGLVQMRVGLDKAANLTKATEAIGRAAQQGAKLVVLPVRYQL